MNSFLSCKTLKMLVPLALFTLAARMTPGFMAHAQETQPSAASEHTPPSSAKINALAHRLMEAGLKKNALAGDELKPWHLKIDYQVLEAPLPKPASGSVEEWYLNSGQWRRVSQGSIASLNGSEWSMSKFEHYQSKGEFSHRALNLRVARPVIDPLYQAANIKPDYEMEVRANKTAGLVLYCVMVVNPERYADKANPDFLFPMMCFDDKNRLRLTSTSDTVVQFDDLQEFQGRAVARDVKVLLRGNLVAEMKVSLLEPLTTTDVAVVAPPKNAVSEPYTIEPGHPMPESVFEVGAHVPLQPNGFPYQGMVPVSIVIHKDGSVKTRSGMAWGSGQNLLDAIGSAVNQWKFKPYIVDGQAVDVGYTVLYDLDAKPFVPSYERAKLLAAASRPDDYWSGYDPKRDPTMDLAKAEAAAVQGHKRILLEVGGDWCVWCKYLDKFFAENADVRDVRDANFVLMKVNMSSLNENAAFLSRLPKIPGYPWIFVLDSDGELVTSKNTDDLENGANGYNAKRIKEFLTVWKAQ